MIQGNNIDIYDSHILTQDDVETNFLFTQQDIGQPRRQRAYEIFKDMNSMVKMKAEPNWDLSKLKALLEAENFDQNDSIVKQLNEYHLWVVSTTDLEEMMIWDKLAQILGKGLFIMFSCGFYTFSYCSFGKNYDYSVKKNPGKENEKIEQHSVNSWSLQECLKTDLDAFGRKKNKKNLFLLECLYAVLERAQKTDKNDVFREVLEVMKIDVGKDEDFNYVYKAKNVVEH